MVTAAKIISVMTEECIQDLIDKKIDILTIANLVVEAINTPPMYASIQNGKFIDWSPKLPAVTYFIDPKCSKITKVELAQF